MEHSLCRFHTPLKVLERKYSPVLAFALLRHIETVEQADSVAGRIAPELVLRLIVLR